MNKSFEIVVDNSKAQSHNVNIDYPVFYCSAENEKQAKQKMKESNFAYKNNPIFKIYTY